MTQGYSFAILVVDDDEGVRQSLRMVLENDYGIHLAQTGREALEIFESCAIDLVLLDIMLPDVDGRHLISEFKSIDPGAEVIMVTASKDLRTGIDAMKNGAHDYLVKPFDIENIKAVVARARKSKQLQKENVFLKHEADPSRSFESMIGRSAAMREVFHMIATVARTDGTVLIQGESGTGKELVARAIHEQSDRARNPYVVINCGGIPNTLMESELFGHRRGAFTGATCDRAGRLEIADRGTLFLDDIDLLSIKMQATLLRVIQQKEFERIGTHRVIRADIRIIAAANKDLMTLVTQNHFREDLFYRLNVLPINLPPLCDRRDDIPLLVEHFLRAYAERRGEPSKHLTPAAVDHLTAYDWPGNVRELENLIERICTVNPGPTIRRVNLPQLRPRGGSAGTATLRQAVREFEARRIRVVMEETNGNRTKAARILGIHRNTLLAKLKEFGID